MRAGFWQKGRQERTFLLHYCYCSGRNRAAQQPSSKSVQCLIEQPGIRKIRSTFMEEGIMPHTQINQHSPFCLSLLVPIQSKPISSSSNCDPDEHPSKLHLHYKSSQSKSCFLSKNAHRFINGFKTGCLTYPNPDQVCSATKSEQTLLSGLFLFESQMVAVSMWCSRFFFVLLCF